MTVVRRANWNGDFQDVAIANGSTATLGEVGIRDGATELWASIENSAHKGLDAFVVSVRAHSDSAYQIVANATSDFTTHIKSPIKGAGADFTSLAKSASGTLWMDVKGLYSVLFQASAAATSDTTLDLFYRTR